MEFELMVIYTVITNNTVANENCFLCLEPKRKEKPILDTGFWIPDRIFYQKLCYFNKAILSRTIQHQVSSI